MNQLWIFAIFIAVLIGVAIISMVAAAKRRKALEELAARIGFTFDADAEDGDSPADTYDGFDPFGRGRARRASNVLRGRRGATNWELFDYRFTTGGGKNKKTHRYGIAAATVPVRFRNMTLRPEGVFDKVASLAGFDDINFESEEFSRRYHVSCDERKFAYDVIHPQMIEFLLRCPRRHWQLRGHVVLLHKSGSFDAREMEEMLGMVDGFLERIPAYVREDVAPRVPPAS